MTVAEKATRSYEVERAVSIGSKDGTTREVGWDNRRRSRLISGDSISIGGSTLGVDRASAMRERCQ